MNIAIIGYGKMGKEIEKVLVERGHTITLRSSEQVPFFAADLKGTDVAIEFTRPDKAAENILKCFDANCPVVVGTTGWYTRLPEIRDLALSTGQSILYSSNFSIGVNVVFHLNRELARIMNTLPEYEPAISEIHHAAKLDAPSGTAITLAEGILEEIPGKTSWVSGAAMANDQLPVFSERTGDVPGTHIITYESASDKITLMHEARNRSGFAMGAAKAAEWLHGKKGCFTMKDFLKF